MSLRSALRDWARSKGYVWFRKPDLPWGVDLQSDLQRCFDLDAFACVFDVGAHVGMMSLRFAQMCPRAKVFAFEMVPSTFSELKTNVAGVDRIKPHCVGLSDESGSSAIAIEQDSQLNSLRNRVAPAASDKAVAIELKRLDEIATALGITAIDLLKIDAEGYDLQVLKGGAKLFEAGKVRAVLVEVDFGGSSIVHGNFLNIAAWLAPWGLRPLAFYDSMVLERDGVSYLDYTNALFVRDV
jgi:FkbM family methyltransferase